VIADAPDAFLSPRDRALVTWARKVVRDPNATTAADAQALRDAGLSEREIFEATVFVALRLAFSTVNGALGVEPDREVAEAAPAHVRAAIGFGRGAAGSLPTK
jgi:alkylhydroperoxidase family enzyme